MKKSTFIIIFSMLLLTSCQSDIELPQGVLTEDKMIDLMVDMEIAQATLKFDAASEGLKPNYTKAFTEVFESYSINKKEFNVSLNYYCSEPIKIRIIYDQVIVKLSEKQGELVEEFLNKGSKD